MPTIITQIEEVEKEIKGCEDRLDVIERSLRLKDLSENERQSLHEEEKRLKSQLTTYEKSLKDLRKENWKSMFVSVMILAAVYMFYHFIWAS